MSTLILFHGLPGSRSLAMAEASGFPVASRRNISQMVELLGRHDVVVCGDIGIHLESVRVVVEAVTTRGHSVEHRYVDDSISECQRRSSSKDIHKLADKGYSVDGHLRPIRHRWGRNRKGDRFLFVWRDRDPSNEFERELSDWNSSDERASSKGREAVIFDMDGTLADVSELVEKYLFAKKRDFHSFHTKSEFAPPNQWVVDAAVDCERTVIVVTARQSRYVGATKRWLERNGVPVHKMYMRGHDDMRPDYDVKRDIVADIEADGFEIVHAFDDNPAVLALWRELGVPVTEVPNPQWRDRRNG